MTTNPLAPAKSAALHLLAGLRDELRERREDRVTYRKLERELAAYQTPSAIDDLLAAVDRQGDSREAEKIRGILSRNLSDYHRGQRLAS